ncbi:Glucan endo-1,3-beta-glucosidase, acidic isoform GL153 [Linum perenne]
MIKTTVTMAQSPHIGVCNGRAGNNLPPEADVVAFYKANGITKMRMYNADKLTLEALKGTNIEVILDVPNKDIPSLATDATNWVQTNILSYYPAVNFYCISVGNEVAATDPIAPSVLPAIWNIHKALRAKKVYLDVSTAINLDLLGVSFPPSAAAFRDSVLPFIVPIVEALVVNGAPLLVNVYPYFTYISNPTQVGLKYSNFGAVGQVLMQDGSYTYSNLFHAMIDSVYVALEKIAAPAPVVVSETGWPSEGGDAATVENASTYYLGLTSGNVTNGTPRKPTESINTYLFAMFDENQRRGAASEQHFGLFTPHKKPKYPLKF